MASNQKPIAEYLFPFLDYCEVQKGLSDGTQENYRYYLSVFLGWLKRTDNERLRPSEFTAQHAWDYRLYLARTYRTPADRQLAKKSQNFYLIALRALLRYFAEKDIDSLPSSKIALAKQGTEGHISFLERHEIEQVMEAAGTSTVEALRGPGCGSPRPAGLSMERRSTRGEAGDREQPPSLPACDQRQWGSALRQLPDGAVMTCRS